MIDVSTNRPLVVSTDGDAGPYIMVPVPQVDKVKTLLDSHDVPYDIDIDAISLDGKPEVTVINLGRGADMKQVQGLLDRA